MTPPALRIAIVGAESTGKSTLATALAAELGRLSGLRCTAVGEWLRDWCSRAGRTPRPDEQRGIAEHQQALIDTAAATHDVVVMDTTPLMTAVYSAMLFNDHSLDGYAVAQQRRCALTLLTALDLPWVADGLQRDGPHVRAPVDGRVRALLMRHGLPFATVAGAGPARLQTALDAVTPLLRTHGVGGVGGSGLFTRLAERDASAAARPWVCTDCDDPACEHQLLRGLAAPAVGPG